MTLFEIAQNGAGDKSQKIMSFIKEFCKHLTAFSR